MKLKRMLPTILACAGFVAVSMVAGAQAVQDVHLRVGRDAMSPGSGKVITPNPITTTGVRHRDKVFLKAAAMGVMTQMQIDQLAGTRGVNLGTKDLAQRIMTEDDKLLSRITDLAAHKGVRVYLRLDAAHRQEIDHLAWQPTHRFDRVFARAEVAHLQGAVTLFENEASARGCDPEIVHFAYQALPHIRMRLDMAQALLKNRTF